MITNKSTPNNDNKKPLFNISTLTLSAATLSLFISMSASAEIGFTPSMEDLGDASIASENVAMADLDADGDLDLFVAMQYGVTSYQPTANRVWFNDGSGHFADSGQELGNSYTAAVALGDMDGDGDIDAVVANHTANATNRLWLNDGSGHFSDSGQSLDGDGTHAITIGDIDNDGDLDIINGDNGANTVWLNDGNGQMSDSGQRLGESFTRSVALGDIDADGDLDLIEGTDAVTNNYVTQEPNHIWLNDGSGNFTLSENTIGDYTVSDILLADLDGDSDLDAFSANTDGTNGIWLNDGAGNFTLSEQSVTGADPLSATLSSSIADFDSDGDPDIVIFTNNYRLFLNQGDGSFLLGGEWDVEGEVAKAMTAGDIDGDLDPDLAVSLIDKPDHFFINAPTEAASADTASLNDESQLDETDETSGGSSGGGSFGIATLLMLLMPLVGGRRRAA